MCKPNHNPKYKSIACTNKMKNKKQIVGRIPKSNIKIIDRVKVDITSTHMHDLSLSWHGAGTSTKSGGVK